MFVYFQRPEKMASLIKINSYICNFFVDFDNRVKSGLVNLRFGVLHLTKQIKRKDEKKISNLADTKMSAISCLLQVFIIFFSKQNTCAIVFLQRRCVRKTKKQNKKATKLKATKFD